MRLCNARIAALLLLASLSAVDGSRQFRLSSRFQHPAMWYQMVRLGGPEERSPLAVVVAVPPPLDYDSLFEDLPAQRPVRPILPPAPPRLTRPPLPVAPPAPLQAEPVKEYGTGERENPNARYLAYGKK